MSDKTDEYTNDIAGREFGWKREDTRHERENEEMVK